MKVHCLRELVAFISTNWLLNHHDLEIMVSIWSRIAPSLEWERQSSNACVCRWNGVCRCLGIIQAIMAKTRPTPASKRRVHLMTFQRWKALVHFDRSAVEKSSYVHPSNGLVDANNLESGRSFGNLFNFKSLHSKLPWTKDSSADGFNCSLSTSHRRSSNLGNMYSILDLLKRSFLEILMTKSMQREICHSIEMALLERLGIFACEWDLYW